MICAGLGRDCADEGMAHVGAAADHRDVSPRRETCSSANGDRLSRRRVEGEGSGRAEGLIEEIARATNRLDGVAFEVACKLPAKTADVDVNGAIVESDLVPPDTITKVRARKDAAGLLQQILE